MNKRKTNILLALFCSIIAFYVFFFKYNEQSKHSDLNASLAAIKTTVDIHHHDVFHIEGNHCLLIEEIFKLKTKNMKVNLVVGIDIGDIAPKCRKSLSNLQLSNKIIGSNEYCGDCHFNKNSFKLGILLKHLDSDYVFIQNKSGEEKLLKL